MSDTNLALAQDKIECAGKEYPLVPPKYGVVRDYVKFLETEVIQAVVRNKDAYGKEFAAQMTRMGNEVGLGQYRWGGTLWQTSLNDSPENVMRLCFMIFTQTNSVTWQEFRAIWNTDAKFVDPTDKQQKDGCKGDEMWIKIAEFLNRPNALRPDLIGTGES